jgi:hypothetical protein
MMYPDSFCHVQGLQYLVNICEIEDDEIFKIATEYWNFLAGRNSRSLCYYCVCVCVCVCICMFVCGL